MLIQDQIGRGKRVTFTTPEQLAAALKVAADAHHEYEHTLGAQDADWPSWYAAYIFRTVNKGDAE